MQVVDRFSSLFRAQNGDPVVDGLTHCLKSKRVPTVGRALDLGAGLGHSTAPLLRHGTFSHVSAVEINELIVPELDAQLRSHVLDEGLHHPAINVVESDAITYLESQARGRWNLIQGIHLVCQLDHLRRNQFFSAVRNCIDSEARLLLDRHFGVTDTTERPRRCSGAVTVDGGQIQRWFTSWPELGNDYQLIRNEYVLTTHQGTVRTLGVKESRMAVCSEERAMDEAARAGLMPTWMSDKLVSLGTG